MKIMEQVNKIIIPRKNKLTLEKNYLKQGQEDWVLKSNISIEGYLQAGNLVAYNGKGQDFDILKE